MHEFCSPFSIIEAISGALGNRGKEALIPWEQGNNLKQTFEWNRGAMQYTREQGI